MGKLSPILKKVNKALDMREAARMKLAEEGGFDTSRVFTHESPSSKPLESIKEQGQFGPGIFSLEGDRAGYHDNAQDFFIRGEPFDNRDMREAVEDNYETFKALANDAFPNQNSDDILEQAITFEGLPSDLDSDYYSDLQALRARIAHRSGAPAVIQEDEFGESVQLLAGNNVRSVNAAFDPAKKESSNLLAGLGGAGILGASMLTPEQAAAADSFAAQDNDGIYADEYPTLDRIGTFLSDIETPIPLYEKPLEGLGNYLQRFGEPKTFKQQLIDAFSANPI